MILRSASKCFVALMAAGTLHGQQLEWLNHYGSPEPELESSQLILCGRNGLVFGAGTVGGESLQVGDAQIMIQGYTDVLIAAWEENGDESWAQRAGGPCASGLSYFDMPRAITLQTSTGNLIVVGDYNGSASIGSLSLPGSCFGRSMFIAAVASDGEIAWAQRATGQNVLAVSVVVGQDGRIHVFGFIEVGQGVFHGASNIVLGPGGFHAVYSGLGVLEEAESLTLTGEVLSAVADGAGMVVSGVFQGSDTIWGFPLEPTGVVSTGFLCKVDAQQAVDWGLIIGSSMYAAVADCAVLSDGDYAISGYFEEDVQVGSLSLTAVVNAVNRFVARVSSSGEVLWLKHATSPEMFSILSLLSDTEGGLYMHGYFSGQLSIGGASLSSPVSRETYVAHLNESGQWDGALHVGRVPPSAYSGLYVQGNDIYLSGAFDSTMVIGDETYQPLVMDWPDLFVAKFNGLGPVGGISSMAAEEHGLLIHANPNRGSFRLRLPSAFRSESELRLRVFDALGIQLHEEVLRFDEERPGVNIPTAAPGLYMVTVSNGKRTYSGNMVVE